MWGCWGGAIATAFAWAIAALSEQRPPLPFAKPVSPSSRLKVCPAIHAAVVAFVVAIAAAGIAAVELGEQRRR